MPWSNDAPVTLPNSTFYVPPVSIDAVGSPANTGVLDAVGSPAHIDVVAAVGSPANTGVLDAVGSHARIDVVDAVGSPANTDALDAVGSPDDVPVGFPDDVPAIDPASVVSPVGGFLGSIPNLIVITAPHCVSVFRSPLF